MSRLALLAIALGLFLVGLPLVSIGSMTDAAWLWWLGLLAIAAGGLIPPLTRLRGEEEEDEA